LAPLPLFHVAAASADLNKPDRANDGPRAGS
jgi:hypothetical protein